MDKDFLGVIDDMERGFQHINVCIESDDVPDFWETLKEDRPKTAEEKLEEAEFVECEIIEENTDAIGYKAVKETSIVDNGFTLVETLQYNPKSR